MCGIIGIINEKSVSEELYFGLLTLQHRGQDAAGIFTSDNSQEFKSKKGLGLVGNVFTEEDLTELKGNMGIGHVRYTTAGENNIENAQPLTIKTPVNIAMASNGNTINVEKLVDYLNDNNVYTHTDSDLEVMLNIFMLKLKKASAGKKRITIENVFCAAKNMMEVVSISYSIIVMIRGVGLLAIRDPYGIKPLVFGKDTNEEKTGYIFASETVAIDALGYKTTYDVKPGEAILVTKGFNVIKRQLVETGRHYHCMFEYVYFARPDSVIDNISVHEARIRLGEELAKQCQDLHVDYVIPVPDTARTAASAFAKKLNLNLEEGLIKDRYIGRTFIMPSQDERDMALRVKMSVISATIKNKLIAVVDDSIVRGPTAKRIIALLKKAKAEEAHLLSSCPQIISPCVLGIDMSTSEELIANGRTTEEIRKILGADSLTYQSIEGLKKAIGTDQLCIACLTGKYPIQMEKDTLEKIGKVRKKEKNE